MAQVLRLLGLAGLIAFAVMAAEAGEEGQSHMTSGTGTGSTHDKYGVCKGTVVKIETTKGDIVIELYDKDMPKTVANFKKLVGKKFYDGLKFHRSDDMCIQGGDPKGNGTGGPGYHIKLEIGSHKNVTGAVAMARSSDPDSAGSQFYILKKASLHLDGQYAVFGSTIEGTNVVPKIQPGDVMKLVRIIREPK
jgi:peptidyl-prolyl cis-trans isomerase B (cyclophilin B)